MSRAKTRGARPVPRDNRPRRSRALAILLGASFVIPFAILFTLIALKVRLGQGYFEYRFSPVRDLRTFRAFTALLPGAIACAAAWMLVHPRRRRAGVATLFIALVGFGLWSWFAPPSPMTQQMFGMTSPSSDGAFVVEMLKVPSLPHYLRTFPQRLEMSVDEMKGTRVLSNPPGMTIFTFATRAALPGRAALERYLVEDENIPPRDVGPIADALRTGVALCLVWVLSGFAAYALGRVFLSPAGAAVFAIVVTFTPSAVHFVPGKDPAQLLTINAMLWAWLAGWKERKVWQAAVGGAILVIGSTFGLVHIWVALAAFAATLWHDRRGMLKLVLAAAAGAFVVVLAAYIAIGWSIPLTLLAVARRWGEIQKTFEMNRAVWYAIGLPIFLLFVSPPVWAFAALSLRRRRLNFGTELALCTVGVMFIIYFVLGMTYELPRLWVAFLPTLLLGLCIDRPLLRGSAASSHPRVALALVLIVATQIVFTALHWTLFDVREIEYRLTSQKFYD